MKKRLIAAVMCMALIASAVPGIAAAAVPSGMTSKIDYDNTDPNRYMIEVDLVNQIITVKEGSSIVLQSLCTTGDEENPTGSGIFKLGDMKERFGYFVAFGQYAQYWTQVVRGIYIHSIMYDSTDLDSMSRSAYNDLGSNVSHGCIRVLPHIAQWIFYNCPPGTTCNILGNQPKNEALVKQLKSEMPSFSDYSQPVDEKEDPPKIPATVRFDDTQLRTGFSASRDKTIDELGANDRVMLLQLSEDWCKVRTQSGDIGYVKSENLLCDPDNVQMVSGYAATGRTYVYEEMDTDSERLVRIPEGSAVTVYEIPSSKWLYGEFNGVTGYMRAKYVKESTVYVFPELATGSVSVTAADGTTTIVNGTVHSVRSGIIANLRSEPSSQPGSSVISELPGGTSVIILAADGDWLHVSANGVTGYLHKSCLQ